MYLLKGYYYRNIILILYFQNILFYYDLESCNRPSGVILLEGSYCSKLDFSSGASKVNGKIHPEYEVNIIILINEYNNKLCKTS